MPEKTQAGRPRAWSARSSTSSSSGSRQRTRAAVTGALNRAARINRPRHRDIDWNRTIRANLRHYQPEHRTIVPERLIGYGRRPQSVQRDVVLCVDQSGSMAASVVYAGVFGAVLASMRSLRTSLVVFDTAVVDLTDQLARPGRRAVRHPARRRHRHQPGASPTARG